MVSTTGRMWVHMQYAEVDVLLFSAHHIDMFRTIDRCNFGGFPMQQLWKVLPFRTSQFFQFNSKWDIWARCDGIDGAA